MRNKKLAQNTISALVFQGTTVICGFILPRAILSVYGSEVNGLVNSIAQFLQLIAFLELGVGAVIQSALYKPLADKNVRQVSEVLASGKQFFRKLAAILTAYVVVLVGVYPVLVNNTFGFYYNATLILSMSISYFAQYYFGIIDGLLLNADQKAYIKNGIDTVTLIVNTVLCYSLVKGGYSIQVVKMTTSGIFLLRPVLVRMYINRNYQIERKCVFEKDPVEQKWNGVAQHIAAIVLDSTDIVVLSIFANMSAVSVYSVYLIVVSGIKNLFMSCTNGIGPLLGELWAREESEELNRYFGITEWIVHASVLFIWGCTYKLIIPFVLIYTQNITDVNYNVPVFAALICTAFACYCLRLTYNTMILAAGQYKNTQSIFIISASVNLILSVLAVRNWGLVGVALGTIAALLYQTLHMAYYVIRKLKIHAFRKMAKQYIFDVIALAVILIATKGISGACTSWIGWIFFAVKNAAVIVVCVMIMNLVFYRKETMQVVRKFFRK